MRKRLNLQFFIISLVLLVIYIQPSYADYCSINCKVCESDTVCKECEPELERSLTNGVCECNEGFFENNRFVCESKNKVVNYLLIVFCILFILFFFKIVCTVEKYNPLKFCNMLALKHYPIPLDDESQSLKKLHPINLNTDFQYGHTEKNQNVISMNTDMNRTGRPFREQEQKPKQVQIYQSQQSIKSQIDLKKEDDINNNNNHIDSNNTTKKRKFIEDQEQNKVESGVIVSEEDQKPKQDSNNQIIKKPTIEQKKDDEVESENNNNNSNKQNKTGVQFRARKRQEEQQEAQKIEQQQQAANDDQDDDSDWGDDELPEKSDIDENEIEQSSQKQGSSPSKNDDDDNDDEFEIRDVDMDKEAEEDKSSNQLYGKSQTTVGLPRTESRGRRKRNNNFVSGKSQIHE